MPVDWKRIARDLPEIREAKWDALNTSSGGTFQRRVRQLLDGQPQINRLDARIKTLAEDGLDEAKIAAELGYEEKTVYNHCSKMRKIAGVGRDIQFRLVFLNMIHN